MKKRKPWLIAVISLVAFAVVGSIVLRLAVGALVATDEFRDQVNHAFESELRTLMPTVLTEIGEIQLTSLANLELRDLRIRSGRKLDVVVTIPRIRVTPHLLSLVGGDLLEFDADALLADDGRIVIRGGVLRGTPRRGIQVEGTLAQINVVAPLRLFFTEHPGPDAAPEQGTVSGTFALVKPFGRPADSGKKSGHLAVRLDKSEWRVGGPGGRLLNVPPCDVDAELQDYDLRLSKQVAFTERTGRATIAGALHLPTRADRDPAWDLQVTVEDDQGLSATLARLFRCPPPTKGHGFQVQGPVSGPRCLGPG